MQKICGNLLYQKPRKVTAYAVLENRRERLIIQLVKEYSKSKSWIRQQLDDAPVFPKKVNGCLTVIVADVTFNKRTFGVGVIRSPHLKKNLFWKENTKTETVNFYHELRWETEKWDLKLQLR